MKAEEFGVVGKDKVMLILTEEGFEKYHRDKNLKGEWGIVDQRNIERDPANKLIRLPSGTSVALEYWDSAFVIIDLLGYDSEEVEIFEYRKDDPIIFKFPNQEAYAYIMVALWEDPNRGGEGGG